MAISNSLDPVAINAITSPSNKIVSPEWEALVKALESANVANSASSSSSSLSEDDKSQRKIAKPTSILAGRRKQQQQQEQEKVEEEGPAIQTLTSSSDAKVKQEDAHNSEGEDEQALTEMSAVERRREQNRRAQKKFRQKDKVRQKEIKWKAQQYDVMEQETKRFKVENEKLRQERDVLRSLMRSFGIEVPESISQLIDAGSGGAVSFEPSPVDTVMSTTPDDISTTLSSLATTPAFPSGLSVSAASSGNEFGSAVSSSATLLGGANLSLFQDLQDPAISAASVPAATPGCVGNTVPSSLMVSPLELTPVEPVTHYEPPQYTGDSLELVDAFLNHSDIDSAVETPLMPSFEYIGTSGSAATAATGTTSSWPMFDDLSSSSVESKKRSFYEAMFK
ncbi:hypothetical protein EV182_002411 [Spiromyces aspiralis]|uniref:Uncharacterized protein n=1 Tax=Spiromyces aspiralis TaxID=68401 RepID=A0ACC1HI15_9FUNG|nr:hypothetical protein EV182_002411 [Spiromyces aspiralis]